MRPLARWSRSRVRWGISPRSCAAAAALILATAGIGGFFSLHESYPKAAAASGGCGSGVPASKCSPVGTQTTKPGPPGTTVPTSNLPAPPASANSLPTVPSATQCGSGFLSSSELQKLEGAFGALTCFRFDGSDQWVVVGNGTTVNPSGGLPQVAPSGSMVAVLECSPSDDACLSANTTHTFSSFTVYYPPEPFSRSDLVGYYGEGILQIADAGCSLFLFDVNTLSWYPGSDSDAQALALEHPLTAAQSTVETVRTPPPAPGASAMSQPAPAGTGDCPQY